MLIQPITIKNYQKNYAPRFKGNSQVVQKVVEKAQPTVNSLVDNSAEKIAKPFGEVIISSIKDISNFLKANVAKIDNGKIFNVPITPSGNTLLQSLVGINEKQIAENEDAYLATLYRISKMNDIDFNQKDSLGLSLINKIVYSENKELVELIKDKDIEIDFTTMQDVQNIKNPEFKKLFYETKAYKNFMENFDELIKRYSTKEYHLSNHDYTDEEIEILSGYIKLVDYNSLDKEEKEMFLNKLLPTATSILGEDYIIATARYRYTNGYIGCCEDTSKRCKGVFNLYKITGYNKELFKDLIIEIYKDSNDMHTKARKETNLTGGRYLTRYGIEHMEYIRRTEYSCPPLELIAVWFSMFKESPDDLIEVLSLNINRINSNSTVALLLELYKLNIPAKTLKKLEDIVSDWDSFSEAQNINKLAALVKTGTENISTLEQGITK